MTVWLNKKQLAERLGIHPKTAEKLMMEMNPVAISGNVRKQYRVSEDNLERWMLKHTVGGVAPANRGFCGSKRKLQRRG